MDQIKQKIKENEAQINKLDNLLKQSKKELDELKKELYLSCNHCFVYVQISGGQYAEFEYQCKHCQYSTPYLV